jgi:hypothetical protein
LELLAATLIQRCSVRIGLVGEFAFTCLNGLAGRRSDARASRRSLQIARFDLFGGPNGPGHRPNGCPVRGVNRHLRSGIPQAVQGIPD